MRPSAWRYKPWSRQLRDHRMSNPCPAPQPTCRRCSGRSGTADGEDGPVIQPAIFAILQIIQYLSPDEADALLCVLVAAGADLAMPTTDGRTFLQHLIESALQIGTHTPAVYEVAERLLRTALELGADPDLTSAPSLPYSPMHHAVANLQWARARGQAEHDRAVQFVLMMLHMLKDAGADMRPEASTVLQPFIQGPITTVIARNYLMEAVDVDCTPVVQWILDNTSLAINMRLDHLTPSYLTFAASVLAMDSARLLLRAGADPTVTSKHGLTALKIVKSKLETDQLDEASKAQAKEIIKLLEQAEETWRAEHRGPASGQAAGGTQAGTGQKE